MHYPLISIVRSVVARIMPLDSSISLTAAGFIIPSLTIVGCQLASILAKTLPPGRLTFWPAIDLRN